MTLSQAHLKLFAAGFDYPVMTFEVPSTSQSEYWNIFCLDASLGLKGVATMNTITSHKPDVRNECSKIFGEGMIIFTFIIIYSCYNEKD